MTISFVIRPVFLSGKGIIRSFLNVFVKFVGEFSNNKCLGGGKTHKRRVEFACIGNCAVEGYIITDILHYS